MKRIIIRLGELRHRNGRRISQQALAKAAGVSQQTISNLERGTSQGIDFKTLLGLCDALECEPGQLLAVTEEPEGGAQ